MVGSARSDRTANGLNLKVNLQGFISYGDKVWRDRDLRTLAITLQDEHQLEPNLLLFALYLEQQQQFLNSDDYISLELVQRAFVRTMIEPYRTLRRLGKVHLSEACYQQMLEVELTMERHSQKLIMNAFKSLTPAPTGNNLKALLASHQWGENPLSAELEQRLQHHF